MFCHFPYFGLMDLVCSYHTAFLIANGIRQDTVVFYNIHTVITTMESQIHTADLTRGDTTDPGRKSMYKSLFRKGRKSKINNAIFFLSHTVHITALLSAIYSSFSNKQMVSMPRVHGNISTQWAFTGLYPCSSKITRSLARLVGLQDI